jgi:hypothetical protein
MIYCEPRQCWDHEDCRKDHALGCACQAYSIGARELTHELNNGKQVSLWETYKERVVRVYSQEGQIMSDVWGYLTFATVQKLDGTFLNLHIGDGEAHMFGSKDFHTALEELGIKQVTVDATTEVIQAYQAWNDKLAHEQAERERIQREKERLEEEQAKARVEARAKVAPAIGAKVKVLRGRKVKPGTIGVVFWMGDGRIGIKDDSGNVHWVQGDYCERVEALKEVPLNYPKLVGSEKQVSWAQIIRERAIAKDATKWAVIAMRESSARFWIDNREK